MNKPLFYFALTCGIVGITVGVITLLVPNFTLVNAQKEVITMPSRQTHGDIVFIGANDTLGGPNECSKNIQLNDVKAEECENRLPVEGDFYGPHFTIQNISYKNHNSDIYNIMTYDGLSVWAEQPKEVFEMKVNLIIPMNSSISAPGAIVGIGDELILPVRGYFFTEYMREGMKNDTILTQYIGHGQVQIGGNYWYNVPATYQTWNNGYSYDMWIGTYEH